MDYVELNAIYRRLDMRVHELCAPFSSLHKGLAYSCGFFNGHFYKNDDGNYEMAYFPIPVISINKVCDIEVNFDVVSVSAKLKRDAAIKYDYKKLENYKFEVYGVEGYLDDFYADGQTYEELIDNIKNSTEAEIGFAFEFSSEIEADRMYKFVTFLIGEGFYY